MAPVEADSIEDQADWLELRCALDDNDTASLQDLVLELRRGGTVGGASDRGSEESERIATDAFSEIDNRVHACGEQQYPFEVTKHTIKRRGDFNASPYVFQLLLTHYGIVEKKGVPSPEKTFEELSAHAAGRYLGADKAEPAVAFGFPRRYAAKSFEQALNELCLQIGEGGGCAEAPSGKAGIAHRQRFADQKDGKLDIVAWRPFPDRRAGKLVGFGQCACGKTDWRSKLSELQPPAFFKLWLRRGFAVDPIRMFFVPRRIEEHDWATVATQAGILFDRCRIAHHAEGLSTTVVNNCQVWTTSMLTDPAASRPRRKRVKKKQATKTAP